MVILKDIISYFQKKYSIKKQIDHSIPNINDYNLTAKTIVFLTNNIPTPDKDSGSNRLKEIIISFKEEGYNCILCTKNALKSDECLNYFSTLGVITYTNTNQYKNYFEF